MSRKASENGNERTAVRTGAEPSLPGGRVSEHQGMAGLVLGLQRTHGNRYVQRMLGGPSLKHSGDRGGSPRSDQDVETLSSAAGNKSSSNGDPLDAATRSFMESSFEHDFGGVRLHTDSSAKEKTEQSNAQALTTGRDIYFAPGAYSTKTEEGRATLAHELAHVVQKEQKGNKSSASVTGLEAEASVASLRVAEGRPAQVRLAASDNTALKVTRGDRVGKGIGLGLLAGAAAAGVGLGIAALFGASLDSELVGKVLGAGALVGAVVGGLIGRFLGTPKRAAEGPRPTHLETNAADVPLVTDPAQAANTIQRLLPEGTRVVIVDEGANQPFNAGNLQWVKIRVTTGVDIGAQGWVQQSQLVSRPETAEVTRDVAARLFLEMADATFTTEQGTEAPIPFHYPVDGCYARAHHMAPLLTEKGYASEKVFAVSKVPASLGGSRGGLRVPTQYAGDAPQGQQPAVEWWYHVAPIIKVREDDGKLVDVVLDPSTATGPITIDEWTKNMRPGATFTRKTLDEVDRMVYEEGDYPEGQDITFTAPREAYFPPQPGEPLAPPDVDTQAQSTLTGYAKQAQVHELAAAIRRVMQVAPLDVNAVIAAIRAAPAPARQALASRFPRLWASLGNSLSLADMQRVESARTSP